jgi:ketosteroid isomerase-like protein
MTDTATTESRLARLEARTAIEELVANYCHGADRHDEATFLAIWHDDAVWEFPPPWGAIKGKEEIRGAINGLIWAGLPETHHWTTNLVVTLADDGASATGISDVYCAATDLDGRSMHIAGTYHDTFERRDGRWGVAHRTVELFWFAPADQPWGTELASRFQPPALSWPTGTAT